MALSDKPRDEQFRIWRDRAKVARNRHKEKVVDWADKVYQEYSGENKLNMDTNEKYNRIAQIINSIEETIQPHLFFQNPKFHAETQRKNTPWEAREGEVEDMVDYEYRDVKDTGYGIELENERALLDARLLPFGVTKTTYQVDGGILEEKPEQGLMDRMKGLATGNPLEMIQTPVITREKGQLTERRNPLNVYLDYTAEHITKQKFTVERIVATKEELEIPRYDQDQVAKMEPSASLVPESMKTGESSKRLDKLQEDPEFKGFEIFEIHDLENRKIHTIASGLDDFIEFDTPYDLPEGSQYSWLWFIDRPNDVYPVPPIKYYRKSAYEQSYIYSQVSTQIDKFMPKIGFNVNNLDTENKQRFKNGQMGALVGFNGAPAANWQLIQPTMQKDLVTYLGMMKELLNAEAGVSDYETASPEKRKATEAALISRGVRARRFKPQKRIKGFLKNQSRKVWHTIAKNATIERFIRVLGEERAMDWWNDPETGKASWTDDNLAGDYDLGFDVESIAPQDEDSRRMTNIESLQTVMNPQLSQALLQDKKRLKITPIFEKFVDENLKIKNIDEVVEDLQVLDPEQEHDLWMQGQFPPINELEMSDQNFMMEHFTKHKAWIDSPGFRTLLPEIQQGALGHFALYIPLIQQAQAKAGPTPPGPSSSARQSAKPTEPDPESLARVPEGSVGVGQGSSAL